MKDVQEKNEQQIQVAMRVFKGTEYKVYFELQSRDHGTAQAVHQVTVHKVEFVNNPRATLLSKTCPSYYGLVKEFCSEYQAKHTRAHHHRSHEHVQAQAQAQA